QFGSSGSGNGQFSSPRGIAIDNSGNLYVSDSNNNRVQKFNSAGVYQSQFGSSGSGNGQFSGPGSPQLGITLDSSGNIYVVDTGNNRVEKFSHFASYISQFGSFGSGNGQFNGPYGIAVDSSNNTYVVDESNNRVEKFNSAGVYQSQFGSTGNSSGQFNIPRGIAVDSSDNIYVTDISNNRVQKFNSAGVYQSQLGCASGACTAGSGNGQFNFPYGIAVDSSDNIYVADANNNRVQKFNSAGVYQSQFGSFGSGNGQFGNPRDIAVDSSGNIYVTDFGNTRVEKFNSAGVYQSQFGTAGSGNGQFNHPGDIAVDSSNNIYVADYNNNRVQEFNSAGVYQSQFGSAGSGNGQFNGPFAIAVDSSSNIYVTDSGNSKVEKFSVNSSVPTVSINGSAFTPANGTISWSFTAHNLSLGPHSVTARVTDNAGNTNQVQATFTVDNIFPSFTISSPTNSATLSTSSFTVSGTASDVGTGLASVTWNIDFGSVSTATTSNNFANWSFVTPSLSNGVHTINVNATDKAGNLASQIISVTVHAPT